MTACRKNNASNFYISASLSPFLVSSFPPSLPPSHSLSLFPVISCSHTYSAVVSFLSLSLSLSLPKLLHELLPQSKVWKNGQRKFPKKPAIFLKTFLKSSLTYCSGPTATCNIVVASNDSSLVYGANLNNFYARKIPGHLIALLANIGLGWKWLKVTNTQIYCHTE